MNTYLVGAVNPAILIPCIVGGVVVLFIIALLCVKKKPKKNPGGDADRKLVEQNAAAVDILIAIVTNPDSKKELQAFRDKLKYLMPSVKDEVYQKDEKIKNMLDDFKIAVTRKPDDLDVVQTNIRAIEITVAERNTYNN